MRVKATREGLIGGITASGWIIDTEYPYVALPCGKALERWVKLSNPLNGKLCAAQVLDVGPWNVDDQGYVFGGARPAAESDPRTNGAGIDLGECVWALLGMTDNTDVDWEFL